MNKKSQLTLFILLGIIIIIIFGFLFYISSAVTKAQTQKNINKLVSEVITTSAINYYITICLDQAAKNATTTIGKQGGVIYEDQFDDSSYTGSKVTVDRNYALIIDTPDTNVDVWQGLLAPLTNIDVCGLPGKNLPQEPVELNLGQYNLDPLCELNGPNRPGRTGYPLPCKGVGATIDVIGDGSYNFTDEYSIQKQLADYVSFLVYKCVKEEAFTERGYTMELPKDIKTEVVLGEENIELHLNYPLTILVQGHEPIIKILKFHTSLPYAFKKLGTLSWNIIFKEKRFIFFDLESDYQTLIGYRGGMSVVRSTGGDDNLVILSDENLNNLLGDTHLTIQFGIENRPPVLNCIYKQGSEPYDIVVLKGNTINLPPFIITADRPYATDPDDDSALTFSYSGWKQDEDSVFGASCCLYSGGPIDCSHITQIENCITRPTPYLGTKWTDTLTFHQITSPEVSYTTTDTDVGIHTVTIKVEDEEHLSTSQDVEIFVAQCDEDLDCDIYGNYYYCDGNQIKEKKVGCETVVEDPITGIKYGLCSDLKMINTPGPTCAGIETDACIPGSATCGGSCSNSIDDDGDSCIDTDWECGGTETDCADGIDNDCDGALDCVDADCAGDPSCP